MDWLQFWAMLQSIGSIVGATMSIIMLIIWIIIVIKD
jgi:hypothetical protein